MDAAELSNRFKHHPPQSDETIRRHQVVREDCNTLSKTLNDMLPECREKSLAMTHLEEVMFWSNAAIARNQKVGK